MTTAKSQLSKLPKPLRIILVIVILVGAAYFGIDLTSTGGPAATQTNTPPPTTTRRASKPTTTKAATADLDTLINAMRKHRSAVMLTVAAPILKTLPDDNDGARHQRFLLSIDHHNAPYDTLLIAHNIDLAQRVPVREGDVVTVRGQYEWNERGGVVHWTHHDPGQRREGGWILHNGTKFE